MESKKYELDLTWYDEYDVKEFVTLDLDCHFTETSLTIGGGISELSMSLLAWENLARHILEIRETK